MDEARDNQKVERLKNTKYKKYMSMQNTSTTNISPRMKFCITQSKSIYFILVTQIMNIS